MSNNLQSFDFQNQEALKQSYTHKLNRDSVKVQQLIEVNTGNSFDIRTLNFTPQSQKAATSSFQGQKQMSIKPIFYPHKGAFIEEKSYKEFGLTKNDVKMCEKQHIFNHVK